MLAVGWLEAQMGLEPAPPAWQISHMAAGFPQTQSAKRTRLRAFDLSKKAMQHHFYYILISYQQAIKSSPDSRKGDIDPPPVNGSNAKESGVMF